MSGVTVRAKVDLERLRPPPQPMSKYKPPSRLARLLALAHVLERLVEEGELEDYAEAARRLGVSRARVAQVIGLLSLSPRLAERIIAGELVTSERKVRAALREPSWQAQEAAWRDLSRE